MKIFSLLHCFFNPKMKLTRTMIICSIFFSTSVHACWLYNYWFGGSKTSGSGSAPAPRETRSSSSSSSSASSQTVQGSNALKAAPDLRVKTSSDIKLKQSLSVDEPPQLILTTHSIEAISAEDASTDCDDEDTSSSAQFVQTSPFEQRGFSKPDLSCIIFDDSVCTIICNQVCLLYNFESTGICKDDKTCYCTVIGMRYPAMTFDEYESQSLNDLWFYRFVKSTVSAKILDKIKKSPSMVSKILDTLRKPLRTGDDIKNRLINAYPDWALLKDLKSRRRAPINRFINDQYKLNETGLEKRIKRSVKKYKDDIVEQFSSNDYLENLTAFLDTLDDEDQIKYIFKQVHDTKIQSLIDDVKNYLETRGLDFSAEDLGSCEGDYVDVDYIDNIVAGAIINQFLQMTSANTKSSSALVKATEKLSKKDTQLQQRATEIQTQSSVNVDQCSCSDTDLDNDGSRWELPGFEVRMLKDCTGSVDEVWQSKDYCLTYRKWSTGSFKIEWKKGQDDVTIEVWSTGSIDQTWHLNGASIKLSLACTGSIDESWELGDVSYTFKKWSSGSTERNWKDNNSDQNVLGKYQGYISSWCDKNYFLIERKHCVIY